MKNDAMQGSKTNPKKANSKSLKNLCHCNLFSKNWTKMPYSLYEVIFLLKLILLQSLFYESTGEFPRYDGQIFSPIIERGEKLLNELEENSHLPRYGNCWMQTLEHLRNGCRILTDSIQVDMALRFTDCFLEMSGQERLNCVSERTESLKRLCMSEMNERSFTVYREYFEQTHNMCFFLEGQKWQQETENTIDKLSSKSKEISELLDVTSESQQAVLRQQKEEFTLQKEILKVGSNFSRMLIEAQQSFDKLNADLKNSTQMHKSILADLFRGINLFHNWIIQRYILVDCLLFYMSSLFVIIIATSLKCTEDSRAYLLINFAFNLSFEIVVKVFCEVDFLRNDKSCWIFRTLFIMSCVCIFIYFFHRYEDSNAKLLNEIKEQNRQIMNYLLRMKLDTSTRNQRFTNEKGIVTDLLSSDYEKNSSNEQQSTSRSMKLTPEKKTTESMRFSPLSRYNLRRKTISSN